MCNPAHNPYLVIDKMYNFGNCMVYKWNIKLLLLKNERNNEEYLDMKIIRIYSTTKTHN